MSELDRRGFIGALTMAGLSAQSVPPESAVGVTRTLARWIVTAKRDDLPQNVRKEATRTMLNWVGCAVGGSRHETVDIAISALAPFAGPGQATVLGRKERLDVLHAALTNGISSHIFDYDDTHLKTIIHPAGPVASALLALSEYHPVSGRDFLHALTLGVETECRIGNSVYPSHYDVGWHITGTCGVFGSAVAVGKVLGLNEQQMLWAISLAAVQPVGLKEVFGTMTKSFHPGLAAQNGLTAAFLASKNYTSSNQILEARAGWASALSTKHNFAEITEGLGTRWEAALNTYKPFACGIVLHPTIDACIQLRNQNNLKPEQISGIELRIHPLVLDLTGKKAPQTGLEGKFSVYHAAAVAVIQGAAGEKQFSDKVVQDPITIALRERVTTIVDSSVKEDQVIATILLKDGRKLEKRIENAIGSVTNPLSDKALEVKFLDLVDGVLPSAKAHKLLEFCWKAESLENAAELARAGAA